ncbi:hypothetical protein [Alicyclobacillus shizuokensis]|uniref:hypothetical protein n=1 Tax=Alicyclobacillus shizuokensis TaxID=392014 RepID=UPI00082DBFA2|nr:hypothetical protein [Alicyclobacillus shizuokensis]
MKKKSTSLYRVERFDPEKLLEMHSTFFECASAMGGAPKNANEVFEKKGWLLPFLLAYDQLLWGRWNWWLDIVAKGTIADSGPIPQIQWADRGSSGVAATHKMLTKCLEDYRWESNIEKFADWLLWGFGARNSPPDISSELNEHYYRMFDLFLVLDNPTDYMSQILCDEMGRGYRGALGYFPTPFHLCVMMTKMLVGGEDPEALKRKTTCEPSVGCGAMLLPQSNYILRAYAVDMNLVAVKLCKIQMFWYAPWYALMPDGLGGFDPYDPPMKIADNSRKVAQGQLELILS